MTQYIEDPETDDLPPSRTQLKKQDHARQKLGERLATLSSEQLGRMDLPEELRKAVAMAAGTTAFTARRRHMKYIGTVLRKLDIAPIERAFESIDRGDYEKAFASREIESWRDRLREGDTALIDEILRACPEAERQRLAQLSRNARKEFDESRGEKASKALFRYLKEIYDRNASTASRI